MVYVNNMYNSNIKTKVFHHPYPQILSMLQTSSSSNFELTDLPSDRQQYETHYHDIITVSFLSILFDSLWLNSPEQINGGMNLQNVQSIRHKSKITDSKLSKTKGMSAVKFKSPNFTQDYWHKNEDKGK